MWLSQDQFRKWHPESLEARVYAVAEANALAEGLEDPASEALERVFEIMSWLFSRPYSAVVKMVAKEFGVDTSLAGLHGFWDRFCAPFLAERTRRNAAAARALAEMDTEAVDEANKEQSAQLLFDILTSPNPKPSDVAKLGRLVQGWEKGEREEKKGEREDRKLDHDDRRIKLLEEKAAQRDAAQEVLGSGLSIAEQNQRLREILK